MFHCTWTIPVCPSSAAHFIQSTNLTRTSRFSKDCFEGGGGGGKGAYEADCKIERRKIKENSKAGKLGKKKFQCIACI